MIYKRVMELHNDVEAHALPELRSLLTDITNIEWIKLHPQVVWALNLPSSSIRPYCGLKVGLFQGAMIFMDPELQLEHVVYKLRGGSSLLTWFTGILEGREEETGFNAQQEVTLAKICEEIDERLFPLAEKPNEPEPAQDAEPA